MGNNKGTQTSFEEFAQVVLYIQNNREVFESTRPSLKALGEWVKDKLGLILTERTLGRAKKSSGVEWEPKPIHKEKKATVFGKLSELTKMCDSLSKRIEVLEDMFLKNGDDMSKSISKLYESIGRLENRVLQSAKDVRVVNP